ncbi:MAG: DUF4406 domain-containing protein, partial [Candidatus Aenigmarchaeota archaeon]|nr:DUF4406 domain-containing protein [Candidatus Aenigmarchaeota archaeon]MDW8149672.1 DUF4406 domain-containing protein [Candidatus Aenigmarchaeota archaeon]
MNDNNSELKPMKIYIAGPYSGKTCREVEQNIKKGLDAFLEIIRKGHFPFLPHLMHYPYIHSKREIHYMEWLIQVAEWLKSCDAVLMIGRWKKSSGASFEHYLARMYGKKIFYKLEEIPEIRKEHDFRDTIALVE